MSPDALRQTAQRPAPELRAAYPIRRAVLFAAVNVLTTAACSNRSDHFGGDASVVRDSAGVEIIENTHAADGPAAPLSLAATPQLVVRGTAEDPLFRVVSVSRMSDGGIALANASSAQLRRYDSAGTMLWRSGTSGAGPGEFAQLLWSDVIPGDSLLAYDGSTRRYSLFGPDGTFIRGLQPTSSDGQPVGARPVGLFSNGDVLVRLPNLGANMPTNGLLRDTVRLLRLTPRGLDSDTIARVPGDERIIQASKQSVNIITPPFASRLVTAPHAEGAVSFEAPTYEIAYRNASGQLRRLVRLAGADRETTDAMIDTYVQRTINPRLDATMRANTEEALRALPRPPLLPPAGRLLVDASQRVWAMDYAAPGDTINTWRLFAPNGHYLGAMSIPSTFTVHQIGSDWILGVFRDEDDVEEVRLYALTPSTPSQEH